MGQYKKKLCVSYMFSSYHMSSTITYMGTDIVGALHQLVCEHEVLKIFSNIQFWIMRWGAYKPIQAGRWCTECIDRSHRNVWRNFSRLFERKPHLLVEKIGAETYRLPLEGEAKTCFKRVLRQAQSSWISCYIRVGSLPERWRLYIQIPRTILVLLFTVLAFSSA